MKNYIGIDIGGTKCAVVFARENDDLSVDFLAKESFPTLPCAETLEKFCKIIESLSRSTGVALGEISSIGISCGGPLDSRRGVIMSPPNLPKWDDVHITDFFREKFSIPAFIQNDANACALAEWKYGAGKGSENMVFMTFGTGLGAGIIANGRLLAGANDNAGEVGHIRLEKFGPVGYGKRGSFEGFCSGGGIAQLGKLRAAELFQRGKPCAFCKSADEINSITAKSIAEAACAGDVDARKIYEDSGEYLGRGISILIDVLNPELIVIGSIFARSEDLLRESMQRAIDADALDLAANVCKVVPALLGEKIGDYAAVSVAADGISKQL